jgi:hypothetical protein
MDGVRWFELWFSRLEQWLSVPGYRRHVTVGHFTSSQDHLVMFPRSEAQTGTWDLRSTIGRLMLVLVGLLCRLNWVSAQLMETNAPRQSAVRAPVVSEGEAWVGSPLLESDDWDLSRSTAVDSEVARVSYTPAAAALKPGPITVKPYGILWGDMIFASSRAVPGPFVLWIASEQDQGESTWIADARRSRVGIDILGRTYDVLGGLTGGGKVEIDFFDTFVNENQPGLRLRHVYWEAKNDDLLFLVGQTWDVVSPLRPQTVNFSVGWAAGNIGFRRTQFRVERRFAIDGGNAWIVQGSLNQNVTPDLSSGVQASGVTRETGNWPMIQARLAYEHHRGEDRSAVFGLSGHVGETGFDFAGGDPANPALGPQDDARFFEWSFNTDAQISWSERLRFQSEFFMGSNLSNLLGGISQGVCPCLRVPIRSIGGWAEVSYDFSDHLTSHFGFGIDDPRDSDSLIGRTYNRFVYVNLFLQVTDQLVTGIEWSHWRTSYHNRTGEPGFNPISSPDQPGKANVVDWTVQYRF